MKRVVLAVFALYVALFTCLPAGAFTVFAKGKTILCVGDSITWGSGSTGALNGKQKNTYPQRLQALFNDGSVVINYGVSGLSVLPDPASNRVVNGGAVNHSTIQASLKRGDADIVVLMLGTNDSKISASGEPGVWDSATGGASNFMSAYRDLVRRYLNLTSHPTVYCVIPPPALPAGAYQRQSYRITERILREEITPCIRAVAQEFSCPVIDLRRVFPDPQSEHGMLQLSNLLIDCVHPNPSGYALLAKTVYQVLNGIDISGNADQTPAPNPSDNPTQTVNPPPTPDPVVLEYTLTLDLSDCSVYTPLDALSGKAGAQITLPAPELSQAAKDEGLIAEFLGWSVLPGAEISYLPGESFTMPEHNEVLYGNWVKNGPFSVTFLDPDRVLQTPLIDESSYQSGDLLSLPLDYDLDYDRSRYDFNGWADSTDGEIITETELVFPHSDLTLYARFSALPQVAGSHTSDSDAPKAAVAPVGTFFDSPVFWGLCGVILLCGAGLAFTLIRKKKRSAASEEDR